MILPRGYLGVSLLCLTGLAVLAGCGKYDMSSRYAEPARLDRGAVVILPGIEGQSAANRDIRRGLYEAEVPYALVIYRWGAPVPGLGMLINQTNTARNRRMADELAEQIVQYQQKHPGKPVFLIGHSAGGGVAVFAMESMGRIPGAKPIEGAFLLSASISADYDLTEALRMTRRGLVNVANPEDRLLDAGTAIVGNVDGGHGDSAGRTGFHRSYPNVYERKVTANQLGGWGSPHFIDTNADFICQHAPAWVLGEGWPPPGVER